MKSQCTAKPFAHRMSHKGKIRAGNETLNVPSRRLASEGQKKFDKIAKLPSATFKAPSKTYNGGK